MTIQNADILRVDVVGAFDSTEDLVNSYQVRVTDGGPVAEAGALDDLKDFFDAIYQILKTIQHAVVVWEKIRAYNLTQNTLVGELSFDTPIAGTLAVTTQPPQFAGVVNFPTQWGRVTGRKYFGPLTKDASDADGILTAATLTALGNVGDAIIDAYTGTLIDFHVGYNSPKAMTFVGFNEVDVTSIPSSRRSRRAGVGS